MAAKFKGRAKKEEYVGEMEKKSHSFRTIDGTIVF